MKKIILAGVLTFTSLLAVAEGPVWEVTSGDKVVSCTPSATRTDGSPLSAGEPASTIIKILNTDTDDLRTEVAPIDCALTLDISALATGQYQVTAASVDTDGRVGPDAVPPETFSFLLIPTIAPPSAPTGITVQ